MNNLDVSNNVALTTLGCDSNGLDSLNLTNNVDLEFLQCGTNPFVRLDLSNNTNLTYIEIRFCYDLEEVCVWELPFPPTGVTLSAYGIDISNIDFLICTTSIGELENPSTSEYNIYPNPSSGNFTVIGENIERIDVFSLSGELIKSINHSSSIDMSSSPKGIYIVKIVSDKEIKMKRIVIE